MSENAKKNLGDGEIFSIPARRCQRCGGLLTSKQALKDGYGHTCLQKMRGKQPQQLKGQIGLFDTKEPNDEQNEN